MNKQVIYKIMNSWWSEQTRLLFAPLIPHRALGRILSFPQPSQNEKPCRSGEPPTNGLLPFRLCVGEKGHSPQESKLSPWGEFVLPPVHTSAFHFWLCHWACWRLERSKTGKEPARDPDFLREVPGVFCFVLFLESGKCLSQTTGTPLNSQRS